MSNGSVQYSDKFRARLVARGEAAKLFDSSWKGGTSLPSFEFGIPDEWRLISNIFLVLIDSRMFPVLNKQ